MTNLEYRLFDFKIYNSNDAAYESDDSDDAMKSGFFFETRFKSIY